MGMVKRPAWESQSDGRNRMGRLLPPLMQLAIPAAGGIEAPLVICAELFFLLGAVANGLSIPVNGLLMEISPPENRPAYSAYFNAITAPAFLLPLLAGGMAQIFQLDLFFGKVAARSRRSDLFHC